jgi:hypothetical protein
MVNLFVRRILFGCALGVASLSVVSAQLKVETLTPDGERQVYEVSETALEGIPHDPRFQGGSPGFVTPIIVSTEQVRTESPLKQPFRVREAPKHKIRENLVPGDSTAAQIFLLEPSDFFPQALDAFRWFDAIGPNDLTPPDTNIGVGFYHVVIATNDDFAFYDRHGNLQYRADIQTFLNTTDFMFDPRVVYDYWNGRFLILYLRMRGANGSNGSWWTLMISDDSDPNGNWTIYNFDAKYDGGNFVNQWVDFPHIGFDNEAVYLSGNMYSVSGGFRYGKVRILWKDQIYNAQAAAWYDFWSLPDTIAPAQGYRVLVNPRNHFLAYAPGGGGNFVRVYRLENPTAWHRGSGTPNLVLQSDIGVGAFSPPPNAREPGRGRVLWTVDCRITDKSRLNYPYLYTSNHVGANSGQSVACKYYRLDVSNNTAPRDGLLIFNSAFDAFFPTLEATRDEDMALGLNASNDNLGSPYYVSFLVYEWLEGNPSIGPGIGLRFGSGVAGGSTADRWGDYSASHLDPCDYRTVWLAGEHARSGTWMTSAHEITLRKVRSNLVCDSAAGRRGDTIALNATLTRADTNAGIAGATVTFWVDGAYIGAAATNASGVATLNYTVPNALAPGNHSILVEFNYCPVNADYSWSRSQCTLRVLLEQGDAGDLPETSQSTPSGALSVIDGVLDADDVDMYAIYLSNPAAFTATTVGGASFDTQLWLFGPDGKGVAFNDDSSGTLSTIDNSSGCLTGRPAGVYYLAISRYNRDALGCQNQLIWNNTPFSTVRCPDGPDQLYRVNGWLGTTSAGGVYTISLTNAQGASRGNPADCCVAHNGDVDGNGCVDDADLLAVLFAFGNTGANLGRVDTNCDQVVDDADLLIVLFNFGNGC